MVTTTIYFTREDLKWFDVLKAVAKREGRSISDILKELGREYVKDHEKGNPTFALDKWQEDSTFKAMPTLGESPHKYNLRRLDRKDLVEIKKQAELWSYAADEVAIGRGYGKFWDEGLKR